MFYIEQVEHQLREYYPRQLAYESDILHAFGGIFTLFAEKSREPTMDGSYDTNGCHFWGIPFFWSIERPDIILSTFVNGLFWEVTYEDKRQPPQPRTYSQTFPSWSWAGYKANTARELVLSSQGQLRFSKNSKHSALSTGVVCMTGEAVSLESADWQTNNYLDFCPWLMVTAFCTEGQHFQDIGREKNGLAGFKSVHFDYANDWSDSKFLVVFVVSRVGKKLEEFHFSGLQFLLVEQVDTDMYRCVGTCRARGAKWDSANKQVRKLIQRTERDEYLSHYTWEKKTFRLI